MNQEYIIPNAWSIIEEGWKPSQVESSESLFSIGNGAMGQRANFEEKYSGDSFQGSYVAGVYYPDKTRVGWWKNGYPEYFAKVLNAPNFIGIDVFVDGEELDLATVQEVSDYRRELNMKEGWYERSFVAHFSDDKAIKVVARRFMSLEIDELAVMNYEVTAVKGDLRISFQPYIDAGITNEDTNWDDKFWEVEKLVSEDHQGLVRSRTNKTNFYVATYMQSELIKNGEHVQYAEHFDQNDAVIRHKVGCHIAPGESVTLIKYAGYVSSINHEHLELFTAAKAVLHKATALGYESLLKLQADSWAQIWAMADISIDGDLKAQQGIRFNIFQLNQTYSGKDSRLNIGPKGFTGEKYGGSTYWDTEAYCIPFYMATKDQQVARNLLRYRYEQLDKAVENAKKLGFSSGAALYPMVTMNGEESHNEWEITFEEIHRNGAMVFAIYNYIRYTGDYSYVPEMGLEVMIAIAKFWHQRATYSQPAKKYMILGVTGPNEYENNVNNNWYTNYLAKWCMEYAVENIHKVKETYPSDYDRIMAKTQLTDREISSWMDVAENMYMPFDEELGVYLQQDGFLDKEIIPVNELSKEHRPINQKWSWDRILRSCYIKQADVLQCFYFFEDHFTKEQLSKHFDFYEPLTVHESSLSPCVHSIQAAKLDRMDQAYEFYLRTSRLDLDDYNKEVEEGCHITSMAGTWMSIVEGFGGLQIIDDKPSFTTKLPQQWTGFSFKINFRHQIIEVQVTTSGTKVSLEGKQPQDIILNGEHITLEPQFINA
ncbi:family 65 glycosyl hydrolase [Nonlabens sp. MB-3u-79]|uniref:glycoside hydrolase family 65 protein n=1 Tax=Nonlabens sp. MB-3u-79 TaxID=2058134 RepID=UPI000C31AA01|nr:glycoside hydrolase family 65 protein [Nonlabens sp. MB-3u-79]AUC78978.1 family 65 glycosyl hydrolase [Nonlabens sp. MB-3u-79]|tara:strand:+ start:170558 stop:172861 length:2304 start_codon:yes stop_codon:yes gene_type:complete